MYNHNLRKLAQLKGQSLTKDPVFEKDWRIIIQYIQNSGLTMDHIAKYCGCSQGNISLLKNRVNQNPSHFVGEALIVLRQRISDCHNDQLKIKMLITAVRGF